MPLRNPLVRLVADVVEKKAGFALRPLPEEDARGTEGAQTELRGENRGRLSGVADDGPVPDVARDLDLPADRPARRAAAKKSLGELSALLRFHE